MTCVRKQNIQAKEVYCLILSVMENVTRDEVIFLFLNLDIVPKNSAPGAIKTERTQILVRCYLLFGS